MSWGLRETQKTAEEPTLRKRSAFLVVYRYHCSNISYNYIVCTAHRSSTFLGIFLGLFAPLSLLKLGSQGSQFWKYEFLSQIFSEIPPLNFRNFVIDACKIIVVATTAYLLTYS